jgi:hypothetical protein
MHENLVFVFKKLHESSFPNLPELFYADDTWIWIVLPGILFLSMMLANDLKFLTWFSMLGFLNITYLAVIIVLYTFDTSIITVRESFQKIRFFKFGVSPP